MGKKSVRIAPDDDEKGLMTDPAPMPMHDDDHHNNNKEEEIFHTVNIDEEKHDQDDSSSSKHHHHRHEDNGDGDEEFDWNDDPDQPRPKRRKTTRQRIQEAMRRPCCWSYLSPVTKRFIFALVGSCVFITPAVCVNLLLPVPTEAERQDPNFKNVRSNLQCWLYWAAFQWHIGWVTTVVVEMVPSIVSMWTKMFRGRRSEKVKSAMEYYMSLKRYLTLLILASWNWGCWAFLLDYPYTSVKAQPYSRIIWNVFACIFVACCWLFAQKAVVQVIATRFHREAFSDRLQENKYALKILDVLSKAESRRSRQPDAGALLRNRRHYSAAVEDSDADFKRPEFKRYHSGSDLFNQFQKRIQNIVLTDQPQVHSRIEKNKVDINSTEYAKKVAKKLFYSLAFPNNTVIPPLSHEEEAKVSLEVKHFAPYFDSLEEAEKAFSIFDRDGNGNLTRREFRDTVLQIYKERKALAQSMRDTSQALGKVDGMLLLVSIIATVFISLAIFNVDVWHSLVPLGSCLLALTFVFGNTAKNTFESLLFLFVTHPYDAGDYVIIDDQFLLVHNLGLMGTVFIRGDGQLVYAPTTVLMTKLIVNVRRSGNMGESIVINIDFRTPTEQLHLLHKRLSEWVASQSRDFAPGFDMRVTDIIDVNQLILTFWLPHKGNWQDLGKRFQRRTKFMIAVKDILTELSIRYELPAQRFTQAAGEQPFLQPPQQSNDDNSSVMKVTPQSFAQGSQMPSIR